MNTAFSGIYNTKSIQRIARIICALLLLFFMVGIAAPVSAGNEDEEEEETAQPEMTQEDCEAQNIDPQEEQIERHGGVWVWDEERGICSFREENPDDPDFFFTTYINPFINFLAGVAGLVAVISFVWGGIQYSSAGDDPQKVAKAKSRIFNTVLALLAFLFLYAFLQWLVPGGIL